MERFGADAQVLGRTLSLDDRSYVVIGVARPEFYFPTRATEMWIPGPGDSANARLRPGVTTRQAEAEGTAIAERVSRSEAAARENDVEPVRAGGSRHVQVIGFLEETTRQVRRPLLVMMAAALVVLLVACANSANLLLLRSIRRRRELSVRAALGGSTRRIAGELLVDSLLIGTLAGGVGLLLALAGHRVLFGLLPQDFPRRPDIALGNPVLVFGLVTTVIVSVISGIAPACQARRLDLSRAIQSSAPAAGVASLRQRGLWRLGSMLIVGEIAVSCALLIGAGLLTRSFLAMLAVEKGYEPSQALSAQISFPASVSQDKRRSLTSELLERFMNTRPVEAVGITNVRPLEPLHVVFVVSSKDGPTENMTQLNYRVVSPGYFQVVGMQVVEGRGFDDNDTAANAPVMIVNEAFARRYPIGGGVRGLRFPPDAQGRQWMVIGVVKDVRDRGPSSPTAPIYRSYLQVTPTFFNRLDLVIRTKAPLTFVSTLRTVVVALAACLVPLRRAVRVSAATVLRSD